MKFTHVLVPVDGSSLSRKALSRVANLVKGSRARVTLLHVIPPFEPPVFMDGPVVYDVDLFSPKEYERSTREWATRLLARAAAAAKAKGARCETAIVFGTEPWQGIVREARRRHCDLIAMASHGRRGLAAVLLGSETTKVLTHSKVPVLVCR